MSAQITNNLSNPAQPILASQEEDISEQSAVLPVLPWRSGARPSFRRAQGDSTRRPLLANNENFGTSQFETAKEKPPSFDDPRNNPPSPLFNASRDPRNTRHCYRSKNHFGRNQTPTNERVIWCPSSDASPALTADSWWREGPMPRHLRDHLDIRPFADPRSLFAGCMVWVPPRTIVAEPVYCIREGHPCGGEQLNKTGFDHPGVILSVFTETGPDGEEVMYCTIAQLRTFKRTSSKTYAAGAGQQFRESVPIRHPERGYPEGKLGNSMEQLDLLRGELFNQTYIQLQHIFKVPASKIMVFHFGSRLATDVRLTDASYVRLMNMFGYEEKLGADGSVPNFGPSPPPTARMHGYYGSNFAKTSKSAGSSDNGFV